MENQVKRQSVSRMDDTLIENILYYLPLSDKITFECLSKRIQPLIYSKVSELWLTLWDENHDSLPALLCELPVVSYTTGVANNYNWKGIDKQLLTSVLKKCPNIKRVISKCFVDYDDLMIIGKMCPKLESLRFQTIGLSKSDLDHFGNLYGKRLLKVSFESHHFGPKCWNKYLWTTLLKHCSNLKTLVADINLAELVANQDTDYLPRLEELIGYSGYSIMPSSDQTESEQLNIFYMFCNKYSQTLRTIYLKSYLNFDKDQLDLFIDALCKLKSMSFLLIQFNSDEVMDQKLIDLSKNMMKLRRLFITINFLNLNCSHLLEPFAKFQNLIELEIELNETNVYHEIHSDTYDNKSCSSLQELTISCRPFDVDYVLDIDKYFPKLIEVTIFCESGANDKALTHLSRLTSLRRLILNQTEPLYEVSDSSVCALIADCPLIEFIRFSPRPNITSKTIECLICCANKWPKKTIKFECRTIDANNIDNTNPDMTNLMDQIPNNLNIQFIET